MNEEIYITDFQEGDKATFRAVFYEYHTRLCYFASQFLPPTEAPEDVVQDAYVKLWHLKENFEDFNAVKAFLYITVKNSCLNICKHQQVVHRYESIDHEHKVNNTAVGKMMEAEVLEKLHKALQQLPEGCRTVLHLSYFQELKNKEVAEILHISVNTVKTQKQRGLKLLRGILKTTTIVFAILLKAL